MSSLQQQIAEAFLAQLAASKTVDAEQIKQLRSLLSKSKKPKAEDLVAIFTRADSGNLK